MNKSLVDTKISTYNTIYRKISLKDLIRITSCIILLTILLISIFMFYKIINFNNIDQLSWLCLITVILIFISLYSNRSIKKFGLCIALLCYIILTQFGLTIVYSLLGSEYLSHYSVYTLRFLDSEQLGYAILLGIIGVIMYTIGAQLGSISKYKTKIRKVNYSKYKVNHNLIVYFGLAMLLIVLVYFLFYILIGDIAPGMSYDRYRSSKARNSSIYSYILFFYAVGSCFLISIGKGKKLKLGIFIYLIIAIIFFTTGNKGEVLYPLLACLAVLYIRGYKFNFKFIFLLTSILFVVIPYITANRSSGISNGINEVSINYTDAFVEMGMQIRVSVYMLEQFASGSREFIHGFSYYNPLVNIIDSLVPFINLRLTPPKSFNFIDAFPGGMGFSQIAESYANFGLFGVCIFNFIIGFFISTKEKKITGGLSLAFYSSITTVFINMTRNRFAFVPGQTLIILTICIVIRIISKKYYLSISDN